MNDRLQLHQELVAIMGSHPVYYQPPANIRLSYPCCIYSLDRMFTDHANNAAYRRVNQYSVTLITKDPEDSLYDRLLELEYVAFDHHFVVDNLHHFEFVVKRNKSID